MLVIPIVLLILVSGCITETTTYYCENGLEVTDVSDCTTPEVNTENISISGINESLEVYYPDSPINLDVSGVDINVIVKQGTDIKLLNVSGINVVVYLPQGEEAIIDISGVNTRVEYYS